MNDNANIAPIQAGKCGCSGYTPMFQQLPGNQNIGMQPAPLQTLPLFMQQQTQQMPFQTQPAHQQFPMQQQIPSQQLLTAMDQASPAAAVSTVRFTEFEELPMLDGNIPITAESIQYLNGFLRTQIGRRVKVEFLIGTNQFVDKEGTLLGVGINYILINETDTDDITACDFYNIKFIRFYY